MMFSIFILAMVVAVIWRMESTNHRNVELTTSLFFKFVEIHRKQIQEFQELKTFVDKHIQNPEIKNYVSLKQAEIVRDLEDACTNVSNKGFAHGGSDTFYSEPADQTYADKMPKKKVANKRRKKKK